MLGARTLMRMTNPDADPRERAATVVALRERCAERIAQTIAHAYCDPVVEDALRRWTAQAAEDPDAAVGMAALTGLLKMLSRSCVETYSYGPLRPDSVRFGQPLDLELHDRGGAILHHLAYDCASLLCMIAHGERGAVMVKRFDEQQARDTRRIAELIGERLKIRR